jgi:hypothetical protein
MLCKGDLSKEHKLQVFAMFRKIFGSKRYGVSGEWRVLYGEELCE